MTRDDLLNSTTARVVFCVMPIVIALAPLWYVWWLLGKSWIVGIPIAIFTSSMAWIGALHALSDPPTAG